MRSLRAPSDTIHAVPKGPAGDRMGSWQRFLDDDRGAVSAAVIAVLLGAIGLSVTALGAVLSVIPVVLTGVSVSVLGFATYLIGEKVKADRARAARQTSRARGAQARKDAQADFAALAKDSMVQPRSPLADAAVRALTGDAAAAPGGIYPPLGNHHHAPAANHAGTYDDGGSVSFEEVTFTELGSGAPTHAQIPQAFHGSPSTAARDAPTNSPSRAGIHPPRARVQPAGSGTGSSLLMAHPEPAERDFRAWPGSERVSDWERFSRPEHEPVNEERHAEVRRAMEERRARLAERLPMVGSMLTASNDPTTRRDPNAGKTRGKCSRCESIIWAPTERPIVLRCANCGHKAKLY